jgi:hypothetical protein
MDALYSTLGDKLLQAELPDQMLYAFIILMNIPKINSKMFAPIHTPTNND